MLCQINWKKIQLVDMFERQCFIMWQNASLIKLKKKIVRQMKLGKTTCVHVFVSRISADKCRVTERKSSEEKDDSL